MCTPGAASLATQAVGAGMQIGGAYSSAVMQKIGLRAQANIDEINATLADQAGRNELAAGEKQQEALSLKGAEVKGAQRAAIAGGGIDLASPSAVAALTSTDYFTESDINQARANAIQAAWGHRIQGVGYRSDAIGKRAEASSISPLKAALSTALGAGSQVASSWYTLNKEGALGGSRTPPVAARSTGVQEAGSWPLVSG